MVPEQIGKWILTVITLEAHVILQIIEETILIQAQIEKLTIQEIDQSLLTDIKGLSSPSGHKKDQVRQELEFQKLLTFQFTYEANKINRIIKFHLIV